MDPVQTPVNKSGKTRRGKSTQAAKLIPAIARGALRRQGFACSEVVTRWPEIAGRDIASHSIPLKLNFPPGRRRGGTLHVKADSAFALELQHRAPRLVERINRYYGYAAVERIAIVQAPLRRADQTPNAGDSNSPPIVPSPKVEQRLEPIRDDSLRQSLARLGNRIFGRSE